MRVIAACLVAAALSACANNYPARTVSYQPTELQRPGVQPGESELLAVRIEAFAPGPLPEDPKVARGLSPEIRNAESYYVPVQLKNTMQRSGHWGPVRVVPKGAREGEVIVAGKIVESDGEVLKLQINVRDAAGAQWFTKDYASVIDQAAYDKAAQDGVDPFQHLYNEIANDIAAHKQELRPEEKVSIHQVAELRFGAEFAPAVYGGHLQPHSPPKPAGDMQKLISFFSPTPETRKPVFAVARLPAEGDPVVQRVNRIRAREEYLVDTLDQQYDGLARGIGGAYTQWRSSRLKEIYAIRKSDAAQNEEQAKGVAIGVLAVLAGAALASQGNNGCYSCASTGVAVGAVGLAIGAQMAIQAAEQASSEADLHRAALEELGKSVADDVKPTVVEVEGKTVELTGTIEEKFQQWREVLDELRANETAPLPAVAPAAPPGTVPTS